jgi:hypothetical protein
LGRSAIQIKNWQLTEADGCPPQAIYPLWKKYNENRRGHAETRRAMAGRSRQSGMRRQIIDKYPEQLKFGFM